MTTQSRARHGQGPTLRSPPPLPYRGLAGLLVVGALCGILLAVLHSDLPHLKVLDAGAAGLYALVAALVWFVLPRIPGRWGLDIAVWFTSLSTFAAIAFIDLPEGRVLTGFELVLFAVFAAYFLPLRRFVLAFTVMAIGYGVAVLLIGAPIPVAYYVVIIFITASASGFVAVLVNQLRAQATTDALTGLLNRRGLELATQYMARDKATAVALLDLNDFKMYNDRYGHLAGDRRLADIAQGLRKVLGSTDVTARFGGDEFTVVMPGKTAEQARHVLLRASGTPPAFSIGVTDWPPGEPLSAALQRADELLYRAKTQR